MIKTSYILFPVLAVALLSCETPENPRLEGADVIIAEGNDTYTY